ncbi:MAG: CoA pyrophosphatase [Corynebacterium glucuronolyticum]|nr:CoA pyrophosphatase [Corynebacterium glucuronolyticum]MDD7587682.1 CoA pyrophosphatase [Mycobacteriaceae bacterium]MDY5833928.1 CoA pyrophosphatase [Corynebacterium glucuronolyticum]
MIPTWMTHVAESTPQINRLLGHLPAENRDQQAAVLMLFSGDSEADTVPRDAGVLLTHRNPTMRTHSGQIAFPGGRMDPTDDGPVHTALREAWEETGLDPNTVQPFMQLDEVRIRRSGYPIHPIIAYWVEPEEVYPASLDETDDVFEAPLYHLLDPANRLMVGHGAWKGPAFSINGYIVWGFTAGLLHAVFRGAGWEKPWDKSVHDLSTVLSHSRNGERLR